MSELEEKQKMFCKEYLVDFNGTQAAIRAGYSKKTANEQASRLLAKVNVQTYLKQLIEKRNERTKITQDEVIADIIKVKDRCMQNEAVLDKEGNETGIYKFDSNGANKALDMLMKHTGGYETDNKQKAFNISVNDMSSTPFYNFLVILLILFS